MVVVLRAGARFFTSAGAVFTRVLLLLFVLVAGARGRGGTPAGRYQRKWDASALVRSTNTRARLLVVRRMELSRVMDEDYKIDDEEEEDVVGLLFAVRTSDEDFVPPVGVGQGQGSKSKP